MAYFIFILLIGFFLVSIYWTFYLKFPLVCKRKTIKNLKKTDLQTFFLSLATNLGVGNIIGVSAAIYFGGPGSIFWMFIFSLFSSSLSYIETYYSIESQVQINNELVGGTCYTIDRFITSRYKIIVSLIFAVFLILSNSILFTPVQLKAIFNVFTGRFRIIYILFTIITILIIIFKGIKSIIKITDFVVPIMTITFVLVIIIGIINKLDRLDEVINLIICDAFNFKNCLIGSFVSMFNTSITKSMFSNEAGLGTMPSLTGISKRKDIEKTSYLQLISVIVDTCILCTLTGIFILLYSNDFNTLNAVGLISCLQNFLGNIGLVIGKVLVYIFGFSSAIGLYYLGESNILYFSYKFSIDNKKTKFVFQLFYILGIIITLVCNFQSLLNLADIGLILLGIINIIILFSIEKRYKFLKNNNIKTLEENE